MAKRLFSSKIDRQELVENIKAFESLNAEYHDRCNIMTEYERYVFSREGEEMLKKITLVISRILLEIND